MNIQIIVFISIVVTYLFEIIVNAFNYSYKNAPIDSVVEDIYDTQSYSKWRSYNMHLTKYKMIQLSFILVFTLLFIFGGVYHSIDVMTKRFFSNIYVQTLSFIYIYFFSLTLMKSCFRYYKTFYIEEKYGFNKTTKKSFFIELVTTTTTMSFLIGLFLFLLLFLFLNVSTNFYIVGLIVILIIMILAYLLYVPLILPIFNRVTGLEDGELKQKITSFSNSLSFTIENIKIVETSKKSTKLNAFFSGFGKHRQIVLYDTLLEKMNHEEIIASIAHEIGHSKHKHGLYQLLRTVIVIVIYFMLAFILINSPVTSNAFGFDSIHLGLMIIIFTSLTNTIDIFIDPLINVFSRKAEYKADNFAAVNYSHEMMTSVLRILTRENYSNLTPHPIYVIFKETHPTKANRIKAIMKTRK